MINKKKYLLKLFKYLLLVLITSVATLYFYNKLFMKYHYCEQCMTTQSNGVSFGSCIDNYYFIKTVQPTESQQKQIRKIDEKCNIKKKNIIDNIERKQQQLAKYFKDIQHFENEIFDTIKELNILNNELNIITIEHIIRINSVLDKNQQERFNKYISENF